MLLNLLEIDVFQLFKRFSKRLTFCYCLNKIYRQTRLYILMKRNIYMIVKNVNHIMEAEVFKLKKKTCLKLLR